MRYLRRFGAMMFVLSLATFLPCVARADTIDFQKVVYSVDDYTSYKYVVVSDNIYNAAALAFGVPPQIISPEIKSKLSDPNYGGKFYEYAHTFEEVDFSGLPSWVNFPDWIPAYVYPTMTLAYTSSVYLGGHVYASSVSNIDATLARNDFEAILRGEDVGSGDGQLDDYVTFSGTTAYVNEYLNGRYDLLFPGVGGITYSKCTANTGVGGDYVLFPAEYTVSFPNTTAFAEFVAEHPLNEYTYLMDLINGDNNGRASRVIYVWPNDDVTLDFTNSTNSGYRGNNVLTAIRSTSTAIKIRFSKQSYTFDGTNIGFAASSFTVGSGNPEGFIALYTRNWSLLSSSVSDPEGDWPSDPETPSPTPPQLPEPGDDPYTPDVPEPRDPPTWPEPDFPPGYQPTDLTDILSYLKAINDNLIAIIDDLEDGFSDVITSFQHLYRILDDIDGDLEDHCSHIRQQMVNNHNNLKTYLYNLFHWLEGELDFQGEGYDDSSVVYWLRRIYNKNSTDTYKPNIINDPDGFFDWLSDVIGNILADLISLLPNAIVDAIDTFTELTHFFPFSVPWDIAAIFALLAHDPVIPVFDIPFPWAAGHVTQIHIDLTQWDPVAQMVRPVVLVYFCFRLALLTRDLMGHLYDFGDK